MSDMDDNGWRDANDEGSGRKNKGDGKLAQPPVQTFIFWLILIVAIVMGFWYLKGQDTEDALAQSDFERALLEKRVTEVIIKSDPGIGSRRIGGTYRLAAETTANRHFHTEVTYSSTLDDMIRASGAHVETHPVSNLLGQVLFSILPIIIIVVIFYFLFARQIRNAGKGALQFGKSRARLIQKLDKVTFADVAGIEEAKEEVEEIIDFLRDPEKFHRLGGRIPKGVLMVGPPGTGKTLLARAIAGEADVPFFNISGSDFVEMFVGVGASRVRDMFEQAKKNAHCIIFIDEIDAVGRSRFSGIGGGHDEREQTLNALLVEIDGFEGKAGVIVMAATNRPDVLDPALLRPGRFDRQITIDLPDLNGRLAILKVHAKKVKLGDNVDLQGVARGTPGFSGADLANLVNEAALLAARGSNDSIRMADLEEARDKVRWGKERRSRVMDEHDREVTAYHEAGHALVGLYCRHSIPLHKVTIIPRGSAFLGATMYLPEQDKYTTTRSELEDKLKMLMGGRCAEMLVFNEITSGASMDLKQASQIARTMVCQWGMSDKMGLVSYGEHEEQMFGRGVGRSVDYSEETAREIDQEMRRIVDTAEHSAMALLTEHRDQLMLLGKTLLTKETMDVKEILELLGLAQAIPLKPEPPPTTQAPPPPVVPSSPLPATSTPLPAGGMSPTPAV